MNPLIDLVRSTDAIAAYKLLRAELSMDEFIFQCVKTVAENRHFDFETPTGPHEYARKHEDVEKLFQMFPQSPTHRGLFLQLIEEIFSQLKLRGQTALVNRTTERIVLNMQYGFRAYLAPDQTWQLGCDLHPGSSEPQPISITVYHSKVGQIVPWEVVGYLRSAIILYGQKLYATSLAVMSFAVEATLRSILPSSRYAFVRGLNSSGTYAASKAIIDSDGTCYRVTFQSFMPRSPSDFVSDGGTPTEIQIRRQVEVTQSGRQVDLLIRCPSSLLDYLSTDSIANPTSEVIDGLEAALDIGRQGNYVRSSDLPLDVDDVLKAVRNNPVHFSAEALNTELPRFRGFFGETPFQLRHLFSHPEVVSDFVAGIARFVDEQYRKLSLDRETGCGRQPTTGLDGDCEDSVAGEVSCDSSTRPPESLSPAATGPGVSHSSQPTSEIVRKNSNSGPIRELLNAAFNDDELTTFCFDHFQPVHDDFASGMSKGQKIQRLLEYCQRKAQVQSLLTKVKAANPEQYQIYEERLHGL